MNVLRGVLFLMGGLFGIMMSMYLTMCFIQWVADVIEEKRWRGLWD